ncbi:MAG: ComEA family DNA-binding protein [bacterium]
MLGFTQQELRIIIFLVFALMLGAAVKFYKLYFGEILIQKIDTEYFDEFKKRSVEIAEADSLRHRVNKEVVSEVMGDVHGQPFTISDSEITYVNRPENYKIVTIPRDSRFTEFLVNINKASQEELQSLPTVGPVIAKKIITYRQQNGEFQSMDDLLNVKGIGKKTLEKIKPYVSLK